MGVAEDIKQAAAVEPLFDLVAMSKHIGGAHGGHYVAYTRSVCNGDWHLFDDSRVEKVSRGTVASEDNGAYVLFYIRRDHRPPTWGPSRESEELSEGEEELIESEEDWSAPQPAAQPQNVQTRSAYNRDSVLPIGTRRDASSIFAEAEDDDDRESAPSPMANGLESPVPSPVANGTAGFSSTRARRRPPCMSEIEECEM